MSASVALPSAAFDPAESVCAHCGLPAAPGRRSAALVAPPLMTSSRASVSAGTTVSACFAVGARALRPEPAERWDLARHIVAKPDGTKELTLAVDGLQCGACVWLIESVLAKEPAFWSAAST